jgi:hypothetical protein
MQGLGGFWFGYIGSTFGKICFVFDFILHTAFTVDACACTSILPLLSLIDMTLEGEHKSDAGVGSRRRRRFLDMDSASPRRFETCS